MAESLHSPKLAESLPDKGAYVHTKKWRNQALYVPGETLRKGSDISI